MSLLDNHLVLKYFGCQCQPEGNALGDHHQMYCSKAAIALRVIEAMEQEVKEGDLYLPISEKATCISVHRFTSSDNWKFHCQWLRLPDRFQKRHEVEEKIKQMYAKLSPGNKTSLSYDGYFENDLRELVDLVRAEKK